MNKPFFPGHDDKKILPSENKEDVRVYGVASGREKYRSDIDSLTAMDGSWPGSERAWDDRDGVASGVLQRNDVNEPVNTNMNQ